MGQFRRLGTEIEDFWPDNTDTKMYFPIIYSGFTMAYLLAEAAIKWPHASINELHITAEHIHTECLYYDRYEPSDWTNFIVITYTKDSK